MNLKSFFYMIIAALVVFIVFNLIVPMSVTVVNEGFTEALSAPLPPPTAEEQSNNENRPELTQSQMEELLANQPANQTAMTPSQRPPSQRPPANAMTPSSTPSQ